MSAHEATSELQRRVDELEAEVAAVDDAVERRRADARAPHEERLTQSARALEALRREVVELEQRREELDREAMAAMLGTGSHGTQAVALMLSAAAALWVGGSMWVGFRSGSVALTLAAAASLPVAWGIARWLGATRR